MHAERSIKRHEFEAIIFRRIRAIRVFTLRERCSIAVYYEYSCRSISIDRLLARVVDRVVLAANQIQEKGGSRSIERISERKREWQRC